MSDPMNNRPAPDSMPPQDERKSSNPLIWILVLIALIALGWYFYNKRVGTETDNAAMTTPAATSDAMTPSTATSPEAGPAMHKPAVKRPAQVAKAEMPADSDASPLASTAPKYPSAAMRAREEGTVMVRADIDAMGNPANIEVAKRSGSRDLDRAATDAVATWKFKPAMKGGKAVASTVQVPVDFKLDQQ